MSGESPRLTLGEWSGWVRRRCGVCGKKGDLADVGAGYADMDKLRCPSGHIFYRHRSCFGSCPTCPPPEPLDYSTGPYY